MPAETANDVIATAGSGCDSGMASLLLKYPSGQPELRPLRTTRLPPGRYLPGMYYVYYVTSSYTTSRVAI